MHPSSSAPPSAPPSSSSRLSTPSGIDDDHRSVVEVMASRYLLLYNILMTAGWFTVLLRLIQAVSSKRNVYDAVALPLKVFQTGAVLEIVHALTRIVRTSPLTTILQVTSRLTLVWGVVEPIISVRSNVSFTTMVLAWSLTEIPRYFYFSVGAFSSANTVPFWVTFTRYSTFIPLYPLGAGSEWLTMFSAIEYIRNQRLFSVCMPNRFNFAFDYYACCIAILILYIPGLPYMYSHMLRQRRKYVVRPSQRLKSQ